MLHKVRDLPVEARGVVEKLIGRRLTEDELFSIRPLRIGKVGAGAAAALEAANQLEECFAEIDRQHPPFRPSRQRRRCLRPCGMSAQAIRPQILLRILRGGHRLVLSQTMVYELEEVLRYPRIMNLYGLSESQNHQYVEMLERVADLVDLGAPMALPLADRDDWPVLRTAKEAAIAFCAQYDLRIMRPAELLCLLSQQ